MRKTYRRWRILACLLSIQLLCFVDGHSQSTYAWSGKGIRAGQQKPEEGAPKESLLNVLKELNRTKGVYFLFSEQSLGSKLVNPPAETNASVERTLEQVLKNTGLKFKKVNDRTFVILSKDGGSSTSEIKPVDFTQALTIEPIMEGQALAIAADVVTGKITAADGSPIAGVSITVKGKRRGTSTNSAGSFTIEAQKGDVLVVSYIGYQTQEVTVSEAAVLSIVLQASDRQLSEVVVTALGIQRKSKSLTYSVQKLGNDDLTTVKDANFVNSLSGKVAGVTITKSSSGIGGSTRVVLRGNKSTRQNQPLYVIDGIPLINNNPTQPDAWGQSAVGAVGVDGGDGISNLNPDDIESISVLKGASAAALYGSSAANGVILITTKKGRAGATRVTVSSELTMDNPMYKQPLQFKYGQGNTDPSTGQVTGNVHTLGNPGTLNSWGPVVNAPDHVTPFFNTGVTSFNSISLSGGTERSQTYLSYSFTDNSGMMPTSTFKKHNINFRNTSKYFDDRLTADVNVLLIDQRAHNRPVAGFYNNPLGGLYELPRGIDFSQYKKFEVYSVARNTNVQNWWDQNYDSSGSWNGSNGQYEQNPYWLLNRNTSDNTVDRIYTNVSLSYKLNSWLNFQARGNIDKSVNNIDSKSYATTTTVLIGNNGSYGLFQGNSIQLYGDLLLTGNRQLTPDLGLSATIGTSINDNKTDNKTFGTKVPGDGLRFANKFQLDNILPDAYTVMLKTEHKQVQAVFGTAQLNWKNSLYLDLTARNDWSSTFAFTPNEKSGYFYYSAGLTAVLSDMFVMAEPVTFSKVRISYARVGNDVDVYSTNPAPFTIDNQNGSLTNTKGPKPGTYLQPEDNRSLEAGTEWRFMKDRFGFDFTWYQNNSSRQYIEVPASAGGTYSTWYLNNGKIRNTGVELSITATPIKTPSIRWSTTVNYAYNKNKILEIASAVSKQNFYPLTTIGNLMYQSYIKEGGQWGDIYGYMLARGADGSVVVDASGKPQRAQTSSGGDSIGLLGNPNPKFTLGWNNTIEIKNFTIGFLFDGHFKGKVMSVSESLLDQLGDSKATADARDAGGVKIKATTDPTKAGSLMTLNAQTFYQAVGGQAGIGEYYMYDATNIRLRELSVSYRIPLATRKISDLRVGLIGRNLFFVTKKAPFDPDLSMSTDNKLLGVETFGMPSARSIGASVKVTF